MVYSFFLAVNALMGMNGNGELSIDQAALDNFKVAYTSTKLFGHASGRGNLVDKFLENYLVGGADIKEKNRKVFVMEKLSNDTDQWAQLIPIITDNIEKLMSIKKIEPLLINMIPDSIVFKKFAAQVNLLGYIDKVNEELKQKKRPEQLAVYEKSDNDTNKKNFIKSFFSKNSIKCCLSFLCGISLLGTIQYLKSNF